MKKSHTASLFVASLLLSFAGAVHAQGAGLTREMVKMDRDTFLSMFNWNEITSQWVLKSGMAPPQGVKSREEVIAMRDEFLSMNVFNETTSDFEPIKGGKPRNMSSLTREQVQREATMFAMMYRFDENGSKWVSKISKGGSK
jgi:hypothetical protein